MTKKIQLKNGLSVLLIENRKAPVISVQMWVQTGSADEKEGEEGVSHFIEHLLFKGTKKFGVGEMAREVEGAGGQINAYTSFDETVFYVTISRAFVNMGLEVISEMMGSPKFDLNEIDHEREVVLEEIKKTFDDPHRQASRALFSTVYTRHPYAKPVIGYESVIQSIGRQKLVDYFQSRYVPSQMHLIIVGDFHSKEMESKVERYFGELESRFLRIVKRKQELPQTEPRIQIVDSGFKETILYLAWKIPHVRHKDIPALEVLSMILGYGDSSRLNRSLRIEKNLVHYVNAAAFVSMDPGFFSISMTLNKESLKSCLSGIHKELDNFYRKTLTEQEVKKAIVNLQSEDFYSMETVNELARRAGFYLQLFGDHEYHEEYLRQIQKITCADIIRVFKEYIQPETLSLVFTTSDPSDEHEREIREWVQEFQKICEGKKSTQSTPLAKARQISKMKWRKRNKEGTFEKIELSSGASLILRPNHDTPVVSVKCAILGGLRVEQELERGMTELLSRVWSAGTQNMSEMEMYRKIDQMASSVSAFGGRNSIGLSMQTLSPFLQPMCHILADIFIHPLLSETSVEREKKAMLNVVKTRKDRPAQEALRIFYEHLFRGHPYAKDLYGDSSTIKDLKSANLRKFFDRSRGVRKVYIVACGDIPDKDEMVESFENIVGSFKKDALNVAESCKWNHEYPTSSQRWFVPSQKEQSHLILGYPGLTFTNPRRYSLEVLQSLLSGQGGRLFVELRDKSSLAYAISALRLDGVDAGFFGGYIACSPEKVITAISMMKDEFRKLAEKKVSDKELEFSKGYLLGKHDIDLQKNSSVASSILFDEMYGISYDETFRFAERLASVTSEDVRSLASDIFSKPEVLSLVGPSCPKLFVESTKGRQME